jgi:hypothetical protein
LVAQTRQQECDLMHDEADLGGKCQCERQRYGPEVQAAQRLRLRRKHRPPVRIGAVQIGAV